MFLTIDIFQKVNFNTSSNIWSVLVQFHYFTGGNKISSAVIVKIVWQIRE